ncbi:formyl-CoA transferase [Pseudonocardia sediminis]|uniref:Formyl-CoA transferase n=1 Tax=Pseudonocardia sediminis TaxID=1397368 RepID=A0A4Q7UTP7_PSEST|nr:CoA transferase [Pseudonocardia sediminis]RZT84248.1 formyl-CoA transferase [Pseudonocardia sediminis]
MTEPALHDVRVLDMTEGIAGPYAASVLGDLGADVVKIERPQGDWGRTSGAILHEGFGSVFVAMNRNKRCLGLDVRTDGGQQVVRDLVRRSDVIVSNYRPGAMDRLGLGFDDVTALRPGIVYATVSAFDPGGPYAELPGNDTGLQAASGLMDLIGEPDGPPLRVAVPVVDFTAALFAVQGILAALHNPASARRVDVSLINAAAALQGLPLTEFLHTGEPPRRQGNQNAFLAPAGAFATADGRYVTVSCLRESHWCNLCRVLGREDLTSDPRYVDNASRVEHRTALNAEIAPLLAQRTQAEWLPLLRDADVLTAAVNDFDDVVSDPGLGPTLPVNDTGLSGDGGSRAVGYPVRFDGRFPAHERGPARAGEHSAEVLRDLGYDDAAVDDLVTAGAVFLASP